MGRCIAVHSYRGGTGKTIIATNLAVLYALKGFNVALLDLDFRAPSLFGIFSKDLDFSCECFLNNYLDGRCSTETSIIDISKSLGLKGKFFIGLANPEVNAIRAMTNKSRSWEVSSVRRLFALRSMLQKDMHVDFCILDTSPGVQYNSINAIVSSDLSILVTTNDSIDLQGTSKMLLELYDEFERKVIVVLNKVFPKQKNEFTDFKAAATSRAEKVLNHTILDAIPCYCDVLEADRSEIMALQNANHPFVKDLEDVISGLEKIV